MLSDRPELTYVTACDEAVVAGLLVSVTSFLHQHRDAESLRVRVIDGGIEKGTWQNFEQGLMGWTRENNLEIDLEKWPGELERWQHFPPHWGSWAVYSSLDIFLRELTGWVVFGDVDLFHGREIWELLPAVGEHPRAVGAVSDPFKPTSQADKYVHLVRPEIEGWADYVNTGFLIVDRSRFDVQDFRVFLENLEGTILNRKEGKRSLFDQSLLNGYFAGDLVILPESCNRVVRDGRDFRKREGRANLHFVGSPKPWSEEAGDDSERVVAWAAARAGLGVGEPDFTECVGKAGPGRFLRRLGYFLSGKKDKLAREKSRYSKDELRRLFQDTKCWFD